MHISRLHTHTLFSSIDQSLLQLSPPCLKLKTPMEMSLQMKPKMENIAMGWSRPPKKYYNVKKINIACEFAEQNKKSNFYKVLSLTSENVGFDEIRKAYRSMALQYHPDACPPSAKEESTKRFVELREAYETLSDPLSRRMYDYELGLIDDLSSWRSVLHVKERRKSSTVFPKEVWLMQLQGLKQRSLARKRSTENRCT